VLVYVEEKLDYDTCPDLSTLSTLSQTGDAYDPSLVDWRSAKVSVACFSTRCCTTQLAPCCTAQGARLYKLIEHHSTLAQHLDSAHAWPLLPGMLHTLKTPRMLHIDLPAVCKQLCAVWCRSPLSTSPARRPASATLPFVRTSMTPALCAMLRASLRCAVDPACCAMLFLVLIYVVSLPVVHLTKLPTMSTWEIAGCVQLARTCAAAHGS
jgi:hypothetical protein